MPRLLRWSSLVFLLAAGCGTPVVGDDAFCPGDQVACGETCQDLATSAAHCGACDNACAAGEVCSDGVCSLSCPPGQMICDGGCHDVSSSAQHCGACGNVCAAGELCQDGACTVTCGGGLSECDGVCRDLEGDSAHCGACGNACPAGQVCSSGTCAASCGGATPTLCGEACVDTDENPRHCGGCDTACATGEVCVDGACGTSCGAGTVLCDGRCVDPDTDRDHCGGCVDTGGADAGAGMDGGTSTGGVACGSGDVCVDGTCQTSCPSGQIECGGRCVDPATDRTYCGASGDCAGTNAGNMCASGEICVGGACETSCPAGQIVCGDRCVDPLTDRMYCGAASDCTGGAMCPSGEVCVAGACETSCPTGQIVCGDRCVDPMTDRAYCGAASDCTGGAMCASGEVCVAGACETSCPVGQTACAGFCVFTDRDPSHCGGCGITCPEPAFASAVCSASTCSYICDAGRGDCNGDGSDGCEVDLTSDPTSCGTCGNVCPDRPNSSPICSASACDYVCDAGYADCNGVATDGCEVQTDVDLEHCGACGNSCPTPPSSTRTCSAGTCGYTCLAGTDDCDGLASNGCEATLATDPSHCGACGNACPTGTCAGGVCGTYCRTAPKRILVYGPGGTAGSATLSGGESITVASDAMWRAMTTADFGQYDVIMIDGNRCGGSLDSVFGTADDTVATWGPAVTGRVVLITGDPDLHTSPPATRFYQNSIDWVGELGRNADGGRTGLFFSWGCTLASSGYTAGSGVRGSPERFSSVLGTPISGDPYNYCNAVTTATGATHPVLAGITSYWSCPMHGGFTTLPSAFDVLSRGGSGPNNPTLVARDTAMGCVPPP